MYWCQANATVAFSTHSNWLKRMGACNPAHATLQNGPSTVHISRAVWEEGGGSFLSVGGKKEGEGSGQEQQGRQDLSPQPSPPYLPTQSSRKAVTNSNHGSIKSCADSQGAWHPVWPEAPGCVRLHLRWPRCRGQNPRGAGRMQGRWAEGRQSGTVTKSVCSCRKESRHTKVQNLCDVCGGVTLIRKPF